MNFGRSVAIVGITVLLALFFVPRTVDLFDPARPSHRFHNNSISCLFVAIGWQSAVHDGDAISLPIGIIAGVLIAALAATPIRHAPRRIWTTNASAVGALGAVVGTWLFSPPRSGEDTLLYLAVILVAGLIISAVSGWVAYEIFLAPRYGKDSR